MSAGRLQLRAHHLLHKHAGLAALVLLVHLPQVLRQRLGLHTVVRLHTDPSTLDAVAAACRLLRSAYVRCVQRAVYSVSPEQASSQRAEPQVCSTW